MSEQLARFFFVCYVLGYDDHLVIGLVELVRQWKEHTFRLLSETNRSDFAELLRAVGFFPQRALQQEFWTIGVEYPQVKEMSRRLVALKSHGTFAAEQVLVAFREQLHAPDWRLSIDEAIDSLPEEVRFSLYRRIHNSPPPGFE